MVTMRATRDALENPWQTVWVVDEAEPERGAQPSIVERDTSAALAEVSAVEAVVGAARACVDEFRIRVSLEHRDLLDALARLDALAPPQERPS